VFGINFRPQRPGTPIAARTIRATADQAASTARLRVGSGLIQTNVAGIPQIQDGRGPGLRYARTAGTISARAGASPGSGPVTFYRDDHGTLVDADEPDADATNITGGTLNRNVWCIVGRIESQQWTIVAADCSSVP
jgi:hypothetical protein